MADTSLLKELIKNALKEGYDPSEIIPSIVKHGFNENEVERAMEKLDLTSKKPKIEFSKEKRVITTDIDRVFEYVKSNKNVILDEAAIKFDITPERLENWAKIWKNKGMVDIIYGLKHIEIVYKSG